MLPPLQAQPVVTPSPGTGSELGADWGPYNVTNSIESGYRFTTVGGDAHLFRSVENYGNGLRLFGGNFSAISKDGHGRFFDSLTLTSSGLGNDPYGMANLRVEKNDRYRYDLTWRRNDYFNASLLNGAGGTLKNTMRTVQDHDLTVSATRWAKLLLGYTRNHETGPEYSAYETYMGGLARSVLPIDRDTRREFNEYRLGTELDFLGFRLSVTHRWEYYKEDSSIVPLIPGQEYPLGYLRNQPFDASYPETYRQAATAYSRTQPMHGRNRGWFGNLIRNEKYWAINARMTYSKGDSTSVYYETASGNTVAKNAACNNCGFGAPVNAFTYMPGTARRPFTAGDFSFSLFPTSKLTIINSTSVQSNRFDGTGNELRVISNGAPLVNRFWTYHIGTGRVSDALDLNYHMNKWLALNAEYRYTSRFIDNNLFRTGTTKNTSINSVRNHLNTGTLGFRLKPLHPLSVSVDATVGRDNGPENPVSPAHFHNIRARADYRAKKMRFGVSYRQMYNLNAPLSVVSVSSGQLLAGAELDYFASHSRDFSANTSFDANRYLSFDLSYTKLHLDTLANLWAELPAPVGPTIVSKRGYMSQYTSNLHTVSLIARTNFKRGTFYAGYNITRDTGDGREIQNLGLKNPAASFTALANTFPMTYQAPLARLSIKITPTVQWNGGWEFYRYNERFAYFGYQPYYRAHTGYTSLSLTF
ncbi:MAG: hypothetical protein DMG57_01660 [Acidobacteria bacterium]|nr:MAG: hypothetical protein DMG57_01660 [Acidobacteriota bacterium]